MDKDDFEWTLSSAYKRKRGRGRGRGISRGGGRGGGRGRGVGRGKTVAPCEPCERPFSYELRNRSIRSQMPPVGLYRRRSVSESEIDLRENAPPAQLEVTRPKRSRRPKSAVESRSVPVIQPVSAPVIQPVSAVETGHEYAVASRPKSAVESGSVFVIQPVSAPVIKPVSAVETGHGNTVVSRPKIAVESRSVPLMQAVSEPIVHPVSAVETGHGNSVASSPKSAVESGNAPVIQTVSAPVIKPVSAVETGHGNSVASRPKSAVESRSVPVMQAVSAPVIQPVSAPVIQPVSAVETGHGNTAASSPKIAVESRSVPVMQAVSVPVSKPRRGRPPKIAAASRHESMHDSPRKSNSCPVTQPHQGSGIASARSVVGECTSPPTIIPVSSGTLRFIISLKDGLHTIRHIGKGYFPSSEELRLEHEKEMKKEVKKMKKYKKHQKYCLPLKDYPAALKKTTDKDVNKSYVEIDLDRYLQGLQVIRKPKSSASHRSTAISGKAIVKKYQKPQDRNVKKSLVPLLQDSFRTAKTEKGSTDFKKPHPSVDLSQHTSAVSTPLKTKPSVTDEKNLDDKDIQKSNSAVMEKPEHVFKTPYPPAPLRTMKKKASNFQNQRIFPWLPRNVYSSAVSSTYCVPIPPLPEPSVTGSKNLDDKNGQKSDTVEIEKPSDVFKKPYPPAALGTIKKKALTSKNQGTFHLLPGNNNGIKTSQAPFIVSASAGAERKRKIPLEEIPISAAKSTEPVELNDKENKGTNGFDEPNQNSSKPREEVTTPFSFLHQQRGPTAKAQTTGDMDLITMAGLQDDLIALREAKIGEHLKDFLPNIPDLDDAFAYSMPETTTLRSAIKNRPRSSYRQQFTPLPMGGFSLYPRPMSSKYAVKRNDIDAEKL